MKQLMDKEHVSQLLLVINKQLKLGLLQDLDMNEVGGDLAN